VGFVVDKVALGRVFSEYFGFPCQSSFHQSMVTVLSGPSLTPPPTKRVEKVDLNSFIIIILSLSVAAETLSAQSRSLN
jgi:hypothetical protein